MAFICTNNDISRMKLGKYLFPVASNLSRNKPNNQEMKELCKENWTLKKEAREDTFFPCSLIGRINLVALTMQPKAILRGNAVPSQIGNHRIKKLNKTRKNKSRAPNSREDVEEEELLFIFWLLEISVESFQKAKNQNTTCLALPLPGIYPTDSLSALCRPFPSTFMALLVTRTRKENQPRCTAADE